MRFDERPSNYLTPLGPLLFAELTRIQERRLRWLKASPAERLRIHEETVREIEAERRAQRVRAEAEMP